MASLARTWFNDGLQQGVSKGKLEGQLKGKTEIGVKLGFGEYPTLRKG